MEVKKYNQPKNKKTPVSRIRTEDTYTTAIAEGLLMLLVQSNGYDYLKIKNRLLFRTEDSSIRLVFEGAEIEYYKIVIPASAMYRLSESMSEADISQHMPAVAEYATSGLLSRCCRNF
jgi:hypothetical protein